MTANGEVQTKEEATVFVKESDLFGTGMLLEETPEVLSLGKLCEDHGYTYHWVLDVNRYTENPVQGRSGSTSEEPRWNPLRKPTETENKNKNEGRE